MNNLYRVFRSSRLFHIGNDTISPDLHRVYILFSHKGTFRALYIQPWPWMSSKRWFVCKYIKYMRISKMCRNIEVNKLFLGNCRWNCNFKTIIPEHSYFQNRIYINISLQLVNGSRLAISHMVENEEVDEDGRRP